MNRNPSFDSSCFNKAAFDLRFPAAATQIISGPSAYTYIPTVHSDSVHDINAQNRSFSARIGSKLVIVYLMALLPPHTKHKFRLVYSGLMNDVRMMFEGFYNLYGTQSPVKTASTSGSLSTECHR